MKEYTYASYSCHVMLHQCGSKVLPDFIASISILKDKTKFLIWFKTVIKSNDFENDSQNKTLNCPLFPYHPCIFDLNLKNVFQRRDCKKKKQERISNGEKTRSAIEALTLPLLILYMYLLNDLAKYADGQWLWYIDT